MTAAIEGIRMKNPAHPGGFVKTQIIEPLGLTVKTAVALGVARATLSNFLHEHTALTAPVYRETSARDWRTTAPHAGGSRPAWARAVQ